MKKFRSTDLYLESYLEEKTDEKSDKEIEDNGIVVFSRPLTAELLKLIDEYHGGGAVSAIRYAKILRRNRAEMHMVKNQGAAEHHE